MKHVPVLLNEIISIINRPGTKLVVDATIGGGGHSEAILKTVEEARLIGIDRDLEAVERSRIKLHVFGDRAVVRQAHFAELGRVLDDLGTPVVDAVVMDLGISSFHLDNPSRGFSFRESGPLDMRMDRDGKVTASDLVNGLDSKRLADIFRKYGEERFAKKIATAIVEEREKEIIDTTVKLARLVERIYPKKGRNWRIHPATRVFQALRIAVNGELDGLAESIELAIDRLGPGGRIAVISFHSLEDRIVKRTLGDLVRHCVCPKELPECKCGTPGKVRLLTRKPVSPAIKEISLNPRARSARLRAAEKLAA